MLATILASIITMELIKYSGYDEPDSAMVKKIESLASLLKESNKHNEELSKEVFKLEKEIFELKHGLSDRGTSTPIKEMYALAGLTDVKGSGMLITINEEPNAKGQQDYANLLQSDDLLRLINVLKSAGANAISINDERLIINSEITNAENCIVINKKKISAPYKIKVLGDFETMNTALLIRGGIIEYLNLFNININIEKVENLTVKAY